METKFYVYLIMAIAYMISSIVASVAIVSNPDGYKAYLIALPSILLSIMTAVLMFDDLFS